MSCERNSHFILRNDYFDVWGAQVKIQKFLTLDKGEWRASRCGRLTPRQTDRRVDAGAHSNCNDPLARLDRPSVPLFWHEPLARAGQSFYLADRPQASRNVTRCWQFFEVATSSKDVD